MGSTMSFRVRRILYRGESTYEDKGGKVIRVGVALPYLDHGFPQRQGAVRSMEQTTVERFHELRGAAVVYVPQSQKETLRPGGKQPSHQTDEFVPCGNNI